MKTLLAILFAAAIWQGCNGCGEDSMDEGTSRGNDTITTEDRYGTDNDINDNGPGIEGPGNGTSGQIDSSVNGGANNADTTGN